MSPPASTHSRYMVIAWGSRCWAANSTMRKRCENKEGILSHDERVGVGRGDSRKGAVELVSPPHLDVRNSVRPPMPARRPPSLAPRLRGRPRIRRIQEHGHTGHPRHGLLEQLQPLPTQIEANDTDARHIPARPCQASDQPQALRILPTGAMTMGRVLVACLAAGWPAPLER